MTPKENLLEVLKFGTSEYIPYYSNTPMREIGHALFLETHHEKGHRWHDVNGDALDNLSASLCAGMSGRWKDIWGVGWQISSQDYCPYPISHPIERLNDVDEYRLPDPMQSGILAKAADNQSHRERYLICGWHDWGVFCLGWLLVGMENFMRSVLSDPPAVRSLLRRIGDFHVEIARQYVESGVEMAMVADDYGSQHSLMISPDQWREFIRPELSRIIQVYKNAGCFFYLHSCGHIMELVDDFIELGVDVLNPIQARANDLSEIRAQTLGKITLHGGIDTQYVMMRGTPAEVREETKRCLLMLGKNGGYLCAPDQLMPFPAENINAFVKTAEKYCRYPIQPNT